MLRRTKPRLGPTAATGVLFDPEIRRAAAHAAPPVARLGFGVGRRLARRRAQRRWDQTAGAIQTLATVLTTFGPQLAQELGLIEPPRRRPVAPVLAGGAVLGAGALYLADGKHRRQLAALVTH